MLNANQQINWLLRDKYRNKITPAAKKDIARLHQGEPLDYIIGWKEFLGCKIDLSLRPLIPRPETEFWVEQTIKLIKKLCHCEPRPQGPRRACARCSASARKRGNPELCGSLDPEIATSPAPRTFNKSCGVRGPRNDKISCLDLFSGSGCIGIAILKHIPQAKVDFTDIDKNCLKQVKINLKLNKIPVKKYRIVPTNVFKSLLKTKNYQLKTYDYIFANPPYISLKNKTKLQKSVIQYEPHQALFTKQNGLYFIDQTLLQAKNYLKLNGQLFLEFSPEQKNAITILLKKYQYRKWRFNKDQFNRWRWLTLCPPHLQK